MSKDLWPLYRWEDGAQIDIVKKNWFGQFGHGLVYTSATNKRFSFDIYEEGRPRSELMWSLSTEELLTASERPACAQIRGFLSDLGIRQHPRSDGLLRVLDRHQPRVQTTLLGPSFIPDEEFDQRYETIEQIWRETRRPDWETPPSEFLGVKDVSLRIEQSGFTLYAHQNLGEQIWLTSEHKGKWNNIYSLNSAKFHLRRLVDQLIGRICIRPESQRAEWESENVERGALLPPFAEPFELYRALDEELPLFWRSSEFLAWVQEM